ncbi:hypothetical protein LCGC14_3141130, partial [marine sediment metagenome]
RVARTDPASIAQAGLQLVAEADAAIDGLFLSCTNLRTLSVIEPLEARLGIPVLSSNQVLAWHLLTLLDKAAPGSGPGRLFDATG